MIFLRGFCRFRDGDESISESYEFVPKELDELSHGISSNSVEFDGNLRRRKNAYNEIMRSYDELWVPKEGLYQAKSEILRFVLFLVLILLL